MASLFLSIDVDDKGTAKVKAYSSAMAAAGKETTATTGTVNKHDAATKSATDGLAKHAKQILGMAAAYVSVRAVVGTLIRATTEQQDVLVQLDSALKSTGGASGMTRGRLVELSEELQSLTGYSDQAVQGVESIMLSFTRVRGDLFEKSIKATLDLATRMKIELPSAARMVGKAMDDPIRGMEALGEAGIRVTEMERDRIRVMVMAGESEKARIFLLDLMKTKFEGAAEAERYTLGGALKALGVSFLNLFEASGEESSTFKDQVDALNRSLSSPEMKNFARVLREDVLSVLKEIANVLAEMGKHAELVKILTSGAIGRYALKGGVPGAIIGATVTAASSDSLWDKYSKALDSARAAGLRKGIENAEYYMGMEGLSAGKAEGLRLMIEQFRAELLSIEGRLLGARSAQIVSEYGAKGTTLGPNAEDARNASIMQAAAARREAAYWLTVEEASAGRALTVDKMRLDMALMPAVEAMERQHAWESELLVRKHAVVSAEIASLSLQEKTVENQDKMRGLQAEMANLTFEQANSEKRSLEMIQARAQDIERTMTLQQQELDNTNRLADLDLQRAESARRRLDFQSQQTRAQIAEFSSASGRLGFGEMGGAMANYMSGAVQYEMDTRAADAAIAKAQQEANAANAAADIVERAMARKIASGENYIDFMQTKYQPAMIAMSEKEMALSQAVAARAEVDEARKSAAQSQMLGVIGAGFGQMASMLEASGEKGFAAWKAFAIAQTIVNTLTAEMAIFRAVASSPTAFASGTAAYALAMTAAGMTAGIGAATIAQIASTQPSKMHSGGPVTAGGQRGMGQDEVIRTLQTGEYVLSRGEVAAARRAGAASPNAGLAPDVNITVVNVASEQDIHRAMASRDGGKVIVNKWLEDHETGGITRQTIKAGRG